VNKSVIGSIGGAILAAIVTFGAIKYTNAPVTTPVLPSPDVVAPVTPAEPATPVDPDSAHVHVVAPPTIRVGELAVIDVSASQADSFIWKVKPETKNFMVIDGGRRAVFSAEAPGEYLFFISAAKDGTVDSQIHTIQVGKGSVTPTATIGSKVPAWVEKVQSPGKRDEALRLAQSFSSVAAMVTPTTQPADIVAMTVKSNRDALGSNIKAWEPFLIELQKELEASAANGSLSDANSHIAAWRSISQSLTSYAQTAPSTSTSFRGR